MLIDDLGVSFSDLGGLRVSLKLYVSHGILYLHFIRFVVVVVIEGMTQNLEQIEVFVECQVQVLLVRVSSVNDHLAQVEVLIVEGPIVLVLIGLGVIEAVVDDKVVSGEIHIGND